MTEVLILIVLLFIIALLFRVDFIFYIVYLTLGVFLWSHWFTPRALRLIHIERDYTNHAFLGENVTVTIVATNLSRLPVPWLQLDESIAVELRRGTKMNKAFSLGSRSTKSFDYIIRGIRRGYYQVGPGRVTAGDLFGFVEKRGKIQANYLTVYPHIIPISHFSTRAKLPFGTIRSNQRLFRDPSRPIGVRDFQPGDSLRHINWKASAHTNELLVKTYRPAVSLETMILINLNIEEYSSRNRIDGPEWAICLAASLAAYLTEQRQAIGMATNGADPLLRLPHEDQDPAIFDESSGRLTLKNITPDSTKQDNTESESGWFIPSPILPNPGRAHLMTILETMARLEATKSTLFSQWATSTQAFFSWGVTVLVLSPSGDMQTCQSLHGMVRRGFNPILVIVEPFIDYQAIQKRARPFGVPTIHVGSENDLKRWLRPANPIHS